MRVLVTGGAGYLGTELVGRLAQHPLVSVITVYDNLSRKNHNLFLTGRLPDHRIRFVQGDILDSRRLGEELRGVDLVYHLAARVTTPFADADFHSLDQVNHWGTAELSYQLETRPVARVVYVSSTAIYGESAELLDENAPPHPVTAYGRSKLQGERMLERLGEDLELHVVRCANVYGYSRSLRFDAVINRFVFEAHVGGRLSIQGSGEQRRAFAHVDTVADALAAYVDAPPPPGTRNLVERNLSVAEIADAIREVYPDVELLYREQGMPRRNLIVAPTHHPSHTLEDELRAFRRQLSFEPAR